MAISYLSAHAWPLAFALGILTGCGVFMLFGVFGFPLQRPRRAAEREPAAAEPATPSYLDRHGDFLCPKAESFFELAVRWEARAKHGEASVPRAALESFAEWPAIEDLACRFFQHPSFSDETYRRLVAWLLSVHVHGDRNQMLAMPRKEVVRLLQEALAK